MKNLLVLVITMCTLTLSVRAADAEPPRSRLQLAKIT